jgi:RNA polymerase sigma-70 factor (ECF subfamily)
MSRPRLAPLRRVTPGDGRASNRFEEQNHTVKTASAAPGIHPLAALPDTDAEVVGMVLRGRTDRFEILMRRHNQRVFRTARAILRSDEEAEDAAQQAWLSAYQHLAQWDGRAQFSTWLTRIVVNESLRRRKGRDRGHLALADEPSEPATDRPSPEEDIDRAQVRALVERAIDALPEGFRVVLVLRDLEELSSAETAVALGMTEEAVRVRLHRARRALRTGIESVIEEKAGDIFPFLGERCHRIVAYVMPRLVPPS